MGKEVIILNEKFRLKSDYFPLAVEKKIYLLLIDII